MATFTSNGVVIGAILLLLVMANASFNTTSYEREGLLYSQWKDAHATFYGDMNPFRDDMGGACGYRNISGEGYGAYTAALSTVLFNGGEACGACFEIKCWNEPQWCLRGNPSVFVHATNLCPPNYNKPSDNGGWCNPPRSHFDLSEPAFLHIAEYKAGIVPVRYRRVPCMNHGGIQFTINGNPYFNIILISNVGGSGDIEKAWVKGTKTEWIPMKRSWGQNWQCDKVLVGQSLSFQVTTGDGRSLVSYNVAPANWKFGQTFTGKQF